MNSLNRDTKPNEWEEEFEERFVDHSTSVHHVGNWLVSSDEVKDFIHQAILSAEKETVKRCIEALPLVKAVLDADKKAGDYGTGKIYGFNQAIDQATKALLSLPDQEQLSNSKTDE